MSFPLSSGGLAHFKANHEEMSDRYHALHGHLGVLLLLGWGIAIPRCCGVENMTPAVAEGVHTAQGMRRDYLQFLEE